jgi:uncharacterized protein (DUF1697 family)
MPELTAYVGLLRAVNVSGTGMLPMSVLRAMGEACGFAQVRTFIASGNLLFASDRPEADVQAALAQRAAAYFGRAVPLFVRSAKELRAVVAANPFGDDKPSRVMAYFLDEEPCRAMIDEARDIGSERLALGPRVVYVSYGEGIAKTKLKIPTIRKGTSRNMNSVANMADLLAAMA